MSFELYDETDFEAVRHLLPDSVMEMVGLIGAEPTLALLRAYGGTTFPVSCNVKRAGQATYAALAEVVGEQAADKLCRAFGQRQRLWLPKCERVSNISERTEQWGCASCCTAKYAASLTSW